MDLVTVDNYMHLIRDVIMKKSDKKYNVFGSSFFIRIWNSQKTKKQMKTNSVSALTKKQLFNHNEFAHDYWVIPILTDHDASGFKTNYFDDSMKHWILAIIETPRANNKHVISLSIYDSLNIQKPQETWEGILLSWLFDLCDELEYPSSFSNSKMETINFPSNVKHQGNGSVNCGYFICLYMQLHAMGKNLISVIDDERCNDWYIDSYYKNILTKQIEDKNKCVNTKMMSNDDVVEL